jgi:tRNA(Ile)-lysidine synthase
MSLHESVRRTLHRHRLITPGTRVAVAVSGGADSVGLLRILSDIADLERFQLAGVAHLNHQLRGVEADRDEEFCGRLAADAALPFDVERIDVGALARAARVSVEQAAHTARHEFFARAVDRLEASIIAVAHTRDDQAETYLLRLLRGAGPRGLGGMHPRSGIVVRPFIETPRADVRAFAQAAHVAFREDASNADAAIPRNRIRHELLPYLQTRFSPGIVDVLAREATIARDDSAYLDRAAADAAFRMVTVRADGVEIVTAALLAEPPALARRVIRDAQRTASGGKFVGFEAVETVLGFAVSNSSGSIDLPGHRVNRHGDRIVLTKSAGRLPRRRAEGAKAGRHASTRDTVEFAYELGVPGRVSIPESACAISANAEGVPPGQSAAATWDLAARGDRAVVEASRLSVPLMVRNRRPGDSFRPLGLRGHKKLQDYFVDAKVERSERDTIPLVVDAKGQIVWVAGHVVAEDFRVTDRTRAVLILKWYPSKLKSR